MSVACIAVVGKTNNPLFLKTLQSDDPLRFHFIVHTSLDMVEEKLSVKKTGTADLYLGLLYPTEDFKVFGYVTNTKIKFIVVVDDSLADFRAQDVQLFFQNLHALFVELICNPFHSPDEPITSKRFESKVTKLAASFSK